MIKYGARVISQGAGVLGESMNCEHKFEWYKNINREKSMVYVCEKCGVVGGTSPGCITYTEYDPASVAKDMERLRLHIEKLKSFTRLLIPIVIAFLIVEVVCIVVRLIP